MSRRKCYLFDIDGTIADLTHRLPYIQKTPKIGVFWIYWDAFFGACGSDAPIQHIIDLLITLHDADHQIILVSGRSDQSKTETLEWLTRHGLPDVPLYMRRQGDHRPDYQVKAELLDRIIADGWRPVMAFDDRDQVVKMWRERGVPCAQVADGNF